MLFTAMLVSYLYRVAKSFDSRPVDSDKPGISRALYIRNKAIHVVHELASGRGVYCEAEPGKAGNLVEESGSN